MFHKDPVIRRLARWGQEQKAIRAMLLTGSRANPNASVDAWSDYDVVLVVEDIHPFFADRAWLQDFGQVLVAYWDPVPPAPDSRIDQVGNVVLFQDGLKIDFTLWPAELLRQIARSPALPAGLDDGYAVLVDKDHLSDGMPAPTHTAYIPAPPTNETYQNFSFR